ncbi:MAG: hypothetical protein HOK74_04835 [Nitrosomonadales bacterium]|nr:hypothetical protein [Nitrosomonadales bacterium]
METKSLTDYMNFVSMLLSLALGLVVTLIVLGSLFSEGIRENVMVFSETLLANGTRGKFILLLCVIFGLDGCWQFNYATFKAKGINRQWITLIQTKYPYQKWLKPIYVITGWAIFFNWIF